MQQASRSVLGVARDVLSDLDLEAVLDRVLVAARHLTGARYAALGVLDESRRTLERFLTSGIDEETRLAIGALPTGHGVLGELIADPVPVRLHDVGAHPRSYGFPSGHPPMTTFLGVPVLVRGDPYGNLYLTDKAGGEDFTQEDEDAVVLLAEFAGIAVDHARRYTDAERGRLELQSKVAALDATHQIADALAGQTDLDAILRLVAKRGRAIVSARAVVIEHEQDGELVVAAAAGEVPPGIVGRRVALEGSVAAAALRTLRTHRLEDGVNRRRFEQHGAGRLGLPAQAGFVVPLSFHGRAYGVLIAVDRLDRGPAFSEDDRRLLEAFAASAAAALATAGSLAADRRRQRLAASEQERARWARELHDDTLQNLAALRLGLAAVQRADAGPEAIAGAVAAAVEQLDGDIRSLRALITDLRPASLDELGIAAAIESLAARAAGRGLDVDLRVALAWEQGRAAERHEPELEIAVYRIVQECLTNAQKHGGAHRAVVDVHEDEAVVEVSVSDDGRGFDPSRRTAGFGLVGMRERAELLDGRLEVQSTPGAGTAVTAALPARRRAPRPAGVERMRPLGEQHRRSHA